MDVNGMCARYWPGTGLKHFTAKTDRSDDDGWIPLVGGWAFFEGPKAPPTTADLVAKEAEYEAWLPVSQAAFGKKKIEDQLRNVPRFKTEVALQARAEGKTTDEIIAETLAKV